MLATNDLVTTLAQDFGWFGIFAVSVMAGFNIVFPIPAPAFVPIFVEAGFTLPTIIAIMVLGTTCADLAAFYFGTVGKQYLETKKEQPKWYVKLVEFSSKYRYLALPVVFFFAAFAPMPNELILAPLGLAGYKLYQLVLPLILGTVIHITILAYGASAVFEYFQSVG